MGKPPVPVCGCGPKNCSSRKNLSFLRVERAGVMGTASCAGRGWPQRKNFSKLASTLIARGTKPRPWHRVHSSAKTPVHSDARVAHTCREQATQQRLAVHERPIRSIQVRSLQHFTQTLYRQVTRNTTNQRATIQTNDKDLQESRILANLGDLITTTTFLPYPLVTFESSRAGIECSCRLLHWSLRAPTHVHPW